MSVIWELPRAGSPGSLTSFGVQLRRSFGDPLSSMDDRMTELIEQLYKIPGDPVRIIRQS
ncbi:hypothetical protein [Sphingomonas abietis]|uniref:Uncharacterized protein n=1 Tax=Sphingomonas abietis TaxID=3012344 RepID=A0ABY7NQ90_9SPHN|nr:hypothetical protein [Sphingomonas abietis]WBO23709.1 hypothetical protein PBT88_06195 [Sphingomonas abietis]